MSRLDKIMKWYPAFTEPADTPSPNSPQIISIPSDFLCWHLDPGKNSDNAARLLKVFQDDLKQAALPEDLHEARYDLLNVMQKIGRALAQDAPFISFDVDEFFALQKAAPVIDIVESYYCGIAENKLVRLGGPDPQLVPEAAVRPETNVIPLRPPRLSEAWEEEAAPKSKQDLARDAALRVANINKIVGLVALAQSSVDARPDYMIPVMSG